MLDCTEYGQTRIGGVCHKQSEVVCSDIPECCLTNSWLGSTVKTIHENSRKGIKFFKIIRLYVNHWKVLTLANFMPKMNVIFLYHNK
jgi:hypothetical protein